MEIKTKIKKTKKMNKLPVMEQFLTLQGEGYHTGRSAIFIRLGGCDVGCVWCDVKESWDESKHPSKAISEIMNDISSYPTDFVVITGGEPSLHNLVPLVRALKDEKKYIAIETSGTNPLPRGIDWVCLSPKKFKKPIEDAYKCANELKVVICHPSDLNWAKEHAKKLNKDVELYLQPEWSRSDKRMNNIIDFINENPEWKLSLQTHKFLNIP